MSNIIENPPENWLERLRRGHKVWLVKEEKEVEIDFPYEAPEPGYFTGYIGIRTYGYGHWYGERWHIDRNGRGINGSLLMLPIEGNLPENPIPLPEPEVRHIHRQLEVLQASVRAMQQVIDVLIMPLTMSEVIYFGNVRYEKAKDMNSNMYTNIYHANEYKVNIPSFETRYDSKK